MRAGWLFVLAWGCAHGTNLPTAPPKALVSDYRVGAGDVLEIAVWRNGEMSRIVPVRPDGRVTLPLVGDVEVADQTPVQIGAAIEKRLVGLVQDPQVAVIVREVNASHFYVVGEVEKPGVYPIHEAITLLQGLAMAGGAGPFSSRDEVQVVRGVGVRYRVDYADLLNGKTTMPIEPGDTIYVP